MDVNKKPLGLSGELQFSKPRVKEDSPDKQLAQKEQSKIITDTVHITTQQKSSQFIAFPKGAFLVQEKSSSPTSKKEKKVTKTKEEDKKFGGYVDITTNGAVTEVDAEQNIGNHQLKQRIRTNPSTPDVRSAELGWKWKALHVTGGYRNDTQALKDAGYGVVGLEFEEHDASLFGWKPTVAGQPLRTEQNVRVGYVSAPHLTEQNPSFEGKSHLIGVNYASYWKHNLPLTERLSLSNQVGVDFLAVGGIGGFFDNDQASAIEHGQEGGGFGFNGGESLGLSQLHAGYKAGLKYRITPKTDAFGSFGLRYSVLDFNSSFLGTLNGVPLEKEARLGVRHDTKKGVRVESWAQHRWDATLDTRPNGLGIGSKIEADLNQRVFITAGGTLQLEDVKRSSAMGGLGFNLGHGASIVAGVEHNAYGMTSGLINFRWDFGNSKRRPQPNISSTSAHYGVLGPAEQVSIKQEGTEIRLTSEQKSAFKDKYKDYLDESGRIRNDLTTEEANQLLNSAESLEEAVFIASSIRYGKARSYGEFGLYRPLETLTEGLSSNTNVSGDIQNVLAEAAIRSGKYKNVYVANVNRSGAPHELTLVQNQDGKWQAADIWFVYEGEYESPLDAINSVRGNYLNYAIYDPRSRDVILQGQGYEGKILTDDIFRQGNTPLNWYDQNP